MSTISVAMATYNGEKYVKDQLSSIFSQNLIISEIVIVDDCSTDATVSIIKSLIEQYPNVKLYHNTENVGPVRSFKRAISICTSDFIALADQDDLWDFDKLEISINEIQKAEVNILPVLVHTDLKVINTQGHELSKSFWNLQGYNQNDTSFEKLVIGNTITGCTILMNKLMAEHVKLMPDSVLMHDHWFALIAYSIGESKAVFKNPISYRVHSNSVTDKSSFSLLRRLSMFLGSIFDRKRTFLASNISQAEQFYNIYHKSISSANAKFLESYIQLKYKSSLYRKLYIGYIKYIK